MKKIIGFVIAALLSGCGLSEDSKQLGLVSCTQEALPDAAYLSFDPTSVHGKKIMIYDQNVLVLDTCGNFQYDTPDLHYRFDHYSTAGDPDRIQVTFKKKNFPTNATMTLWSAPDCVAAPMPVGTAIFNYNFKVETYGENPCLLTPVESHQIIVFQ